MMPARTTIAVPCWSSWNTGMSIAGLVPEEELNDENILPEAFHPRVAELVAQAVKSHIHGSYHFRCHDARGGYPYENIGTDQGIRQRACLICQIRYLVKSHIR